MRQHIAVPAYGKQRGDAEGSTCPLPCNGHGKAMDGVEAECHACSHEAMSELETIVVQLEREVVSLRIELQLAQRSSNAKDKAGDIYEKPMLAAPTLCRRCSASEMSLAECTDYHSDSLSSSEIRREGGTIAYYQSMSQELRKDNAQLRQLLHSRIKQQRYEAVRYSQKISALQAEYNELNKDHCITLRELDNVMGLLTVARAAERAALQTAEVVRKPKSCTQESATITASPPCTNSAEGSITPLPTDCRAVDFWTDLGLPYILCCQAFTSRTPEVLSADTCKPYLKTCQSALFFSPLSDDRKYWRAEYHKVHSMMQRMEAEVEALQQARTTDHACILELHIALECSMRTTYEMQAYALRCEAASTLAKALVSEMRNIWAADESDEEVIWTHQDTLDIAVLSNNDRSMSFVTSSPSPSRPAYGVLGLLHV